MHFPQQQATSCSCAIISWVNLSLFLIFLRGKPPKGKGLRRWYTWDSLFDRVFCPVCNTIAFPPLQVCTRTSHSSDSLRASTDQWLWGSSGPQCSADNHHMLAGMGGFAAPHPPAPWREEIIFRRHSETRQSRYSSLLIVKLEVLAYFFSQSS